MESGGLKVGGWLNGRFMTLAAGALLPEFTLCLTWHCIRKINYSFAALGLRNVMDIVVNAGVGLVNIRL